MASTLFDQTKALVDKLENGPLKNRKVKNAVLVSSLLSFGIFIRKITTPKREPRDPNENKYSKKKIGVDAEFWKRLKFLLRIVLPGIRSKEFLILFLHTSFLIARTFVSIYVATLDGQIVKTIVDRNPKEFSLKLLKWLGIAIPATYINSMIRFLESKLSIAFRTKLTEYTYSIYMRNETYYKVSNLDSRLANADQLVTEDVSKFCSMLAHLHSQLSKPMLDVILMSIQLWLLGRQRTGGKSDQSSIVPTALAWTVVYITARVLRFMTPPFGKLAAQQADKEGELRFVHSRVITNAEEIAFYGGHEIELSTLNETYLTLVKHMNTLFRSRIFYTMLEGFFMKYVWSATGLTMVALPAFYSLYIEDSLKAAGSMEEASQLPDSSTRTQQFITARKLLIDAAEAIERMMSAYKEVTELAGYTSRVYNMAQVFEDVKNNNYQKNLGSEGNKNENKYDGGKMLVGSCIKLENVPIVTPNFDVLIESMNFEIEPGMHLLITGPNGCGKSSLFRILGGLWPVMGGSLTKPESKDLFYIPQRPYLSLGTLRDQITYPDTKEQMISKGKTDQDIESIMDWVNLTHIVEREGGWDSVNDWQDVLSGGEKQRVGMARLFYNLPKYAILDECTSAVSIDVEGKMYTHAIDLGITLMTVTHRPSLWKYHKHLLQFDGEGGYRFSALNADVRLSLKEEKSKLEHDLSGISKKTQRLKKLCEILGEDSVNLIEKNNKEQEEKEMEEQEEN